MLERSDRSRALFQTRHVQKFKFLFIIAFFFSRVFQIDLHVPLPLFKLIQLDEATMIRAVRRRKRHVRSIHNDIENVLVFTCVLLCFSTNVCKGQCKVLSRDPLLYACTQQVPLSQYTSFLDSQLRPTKRCMYSRVFVVNVYKI